MLCCAVGGVYYKGSVTSVREQMPSGGMGLLSKGTYDPWEALEVEWDVGGDAEGMDRVSPWEIEVCFDNDSNCNDTNSNASACQPGLAVPGASLCWL